MAKKMFFFVLIFFAILFTSLSLLQGSLQPKIVPKYFVTSSNIKKTTLCSDYVFTIGSPNKFYIRYKSTNLALEVDGYGVFEPGEYSLLTVGLTTITPQGPFLTIYNPSAPYYKQLAALFMFLSGIISFFITKFLFAKNIILEENNAK